MPLPPDGTISLLGSSRPGETSQSRPKQAMIIRMSEKTLDLLESFPQLHFEFSDNPGIYIGDSFFPVSSVPETSPHDLYLRTSSAAKRNMPLKLYANVTGKFLVERQLDDRITGKLRASAIDAQKERGRTTFVETPSSLPPQKREKKKEPPPMFMKKPARQSDQPHHNVPSSSIAPPPPPPPRGVSPSPPSTQKNKEVLQALRMRMIRCIAITERTSDQVVKLVGGNECSASRKRDILDLLEEIAEPIPLPNNSKAPKNYRLKTKSWLDVRPYELPGLTESDRTNLARAAKRALHDLKIPESDPAWSHVQYRNLNGATPPSTVSRKQPSNGAGSSSEPPKTGITSTAAKDKKAKARNDSGETMMNNRSLKASAPPPSSSTTSRDEDSSRAIPPLKPPASRYRPGSGVKKQPASTEPRDIVNGRSSLPNGKSATAELSNSQYKDSTSSAAPRRPPTTSSQPPERRHGAVPSQKIDKLRGGEYAGSDSERSVRDRDRERTHKNREKEQEDRERERRGKREREHERDRKEREREREKERARRREAERESDRDHDRARKITEKAREREWSQEREEGEHSEDSLRPSKRKNAGREDEDYGEPLSRAAQKKRKVESPPPREIKTKESTLPRKPEPDLSSRPKINKEPSPLPPLPKIKKDPTLPQRLSGALPPKASPSASSQSSNLKQKTGSRRRKSPVFTSSEDEGEIRVPVKREAQAPTIPPPPANNNRHNEPPPQSRPYISKPLPTEHAALRARYNTSYLDYVDTFQKLMKEKTKINNMLTKNVDKMSAGSITDSDGDVELLDPDELRRLTSDYNRLHEELGGIRRILSGNGRTGSGSE